MTDIIDRTRLELLEEIAETLLDWITNEFDLDNANDTMAQYMPEGSGALALARALDRKHGRTPVHVPASATAPVPAGARQGDPVESDLAAASVRPETTIAVKDAILHTLRTTIAIGLTDEELVRRIERKVAASPQRIRTARAEMVTAGVIHRVGTGETSRGRRAALWGLT